MPNISPRWSKEDGPPQQHPQSGIDFSQYDIFLPASLLRRFNDFLAQINFVSIPPPPDLTQGITSIKNQYVAGGSFGDVYWCRYFNGSTSENVAVKALRFKPDKVTKDKFDRMIRRELGVWGTLHHKNVVPFLGIAHGFGMEGAISLVSSWMPNGTLHKFLVTNDDKLDVAHRLQISHDVAEGLGHLHSRHPQIVHGDLNSNNVLIDADYTARLIDFGFASSIGETPEALAYLKRSTRRPGALRWNAPEQINPKGPFIRTTESDIYSFGCIALEVLSGKEPWSEVEDAAVVLKLYQGEKPGRPASRMIDDSHWEVIQRCWSPLQERQRPSAAEIIKLLNEYSRSPLRDLFISSSSQAQDSLSASSFSLATGPPPSPLATAMSPISPQNRLADSPVSTPGPRTIQNGGTDGPRAMPAVRSLNWNAIRALKADTSSAPLPSQSIMNRGRFKAEPNDFIIVVMGPTGSGKTNFINALTGNSEKTKASNLESETQNVTPYTIPYHGFHLVLVDTPGFDDTYRSDAMILRMIADWLTNKYSDGETLRLTGIIYLHRITDNRMSGSAYKNLQMFGRLCGNLPLHRVRLVMTMWDKVKGQQVAEDRERDLIGDFWRPLITEGAIAKRFSNTAASAFQLVDELIAIENGKEQLLLQEELVEQQKRLNETEAGKLLYSQFQKLLTEQKNKLKELADEARMQNDPPLARSLQEEYEKINAILQKTSEEMKEMRISLSRRILLWLFRRKSRAKAVVLD